jgi:hypothetical protein
VFGRSIALVFTVIVFTFGVTERGLCLTERSSPPLAGIAAASDTVFIAWNRRGTPTGGQIVALNAKTGKLRWQKATTKTAVIGPVAASDILLCVPTLRDGVYVVDANTGSIRARLHTRSVDLVPGVDSASERVLIADPTSNGVEAFDTTSFRSLWKRKMWHFHFTEVTGKRDTFELLVRDYRVPDKANQDRGFRTVIVRARDGFVLSDKPKRRTDWHGVYPEFFPKAVYRWYAEMNRKHSSFRYARTTTEYANGIWFFGRNRVAPGVVYAVRGDTGKVLWQLAVPDLSNIRLIGSTLYVGAFGNEAVSSYTRPGIENGSSAGMVMALDARTGRKLWSADVK